jgi:hypothetical protein
MCHKLYVRIYKPQILSEHEDIIENKTKIKIKTKIEFLFLYLVNYMIFPSMLLTPNDGTRMYNIKINSIPSL